MSSAAMRTWGLGRGLRGPLAQSAPQPLHVPDGTEPARHAHRESARRALSAGHERLIDRVRAAQRAREEAARTGRAGWRQ